VHLLKYVVECTATDWTVNTEASCSKGTPFALIHFLIHVTRELVNFLSATSVRGIVRDTCDAIWECLKMVYMSARDKNDWIGTADEFYERTNFLNCI